MGARLCTSLKVSSRPSSKGVLGAFLGVSSRVIRAVSMK